MAEEIKDINKKIEQPEATVQIVNERISCIYQKISTELANIRREVDNKIKKVLFNPLAN